nr:enoyl-CoA hydratase-related protein [Tistrella sp.]
MNPDDTTSERQPVRVETDAGISTIILDRPERRNAVDRPTAQALRAAFAAADADPDVRVIVLWGAGGTFCAGPICAPWATRICATRWSRPAPGPDRWGPAGW